MASGTGALARCYFNAIGVGKSPQRAVELYRQAVSRNPPCPIAMSALVRHTSGAMARFAGVGVFVSVHADSALFILPCR
jgi:hypothetical protein